MYLFDDCCPELHLFLATASRIGAGINFALAVPADLGICQFTKRHNDNGRISVANIRQRLLSGYAIGS